jgi:hypothetical protein
LADWDGSSDGLGIQTLLAGIDHPTDEPKPQTPSKRRFRWRTLAWSSAAGLAILVTAAVVLYGIGHRQGWFSLSLPYHTWLESGEGLVVGDPVLLDGKPVGRITSIELMPVFEAFGNVFIGMKVEDPYFGYIWSDSRAKVQWNPSKQKRYIHLIRGGTSTNKVLHASYQVNSKTGSRSYWDEKAQTYTPLSATGANRFGFPLIAVEVLAE